MLKDMLDDLLKSKLEDQNCTEHFLKIRACLDVNVEIRNPNILKAAQYKSGKFRTKLKVIEQLEGETKEYLSRYTIMHALANLISLENKSKYKNEQSPAGETYRRFRKLLEKENFWTRFTCDQRYLFTEEFEQQMDSLIGEVNRHLELARKNYKVPPKIYALQFAGIESLYQAISNYKLKTDSKQIFISPLNNEKADNADSDDLKEYIENNANLLDNLIEFLKEDDVASLSYPVFGNGFGYLKGASDFFKAKLLRYFVENRITKEKLTSTVLFFDVSGIQRETDFLSLCIKSIQKQLDLPNPITEEQLNGLTDNALKEKLLSLLTTHLSSGIIFILVAANKEEIPNTSGLSTQIDRSGFEYLLTQICQTANKQNVKFKAIIGVTGKYKGSKLPLSKVFPVRAIERVWWKQHAQNLETQCRQACSKTNKVCFNQKLASNVLEEVNLSSTRAELVPALVKLDNVINFKCETTEGSDGLIEPKDKRYILSKDKVLSQGKVIEWREELIKGLNNHRAGLKIVKLLLWYCFYELKNHRYFNLLRAIAHCDDGLTKKTLLAIARRIQDDTTDEQNSPATPDTFVESFIETFRPILHSTQQVQGINQNVEEEFQVIEPIRAALVTDGDTYFEDAKFRASYYDSKPGPQKNSKHPEYHIAKAKSHMAYTAEIHFLIATESLKLYLQEKAKNDGLKDNQNKYLMRYALIALKHLIKCNRQNFPHFSSDSSITNLLTFFNDIKTRLDNDLKTRLDNDLKTPSVNIRDYSRKSLLTIAWELFYHEIEQQPRQNFSDRYFPRKGLQDPYLKQELIRYFCGIGYAHRVRYFHMSKTLLSLMEPFQMLHFLNAATVNAYENNNLQDIHLITEAYNQYFVNIQKYQPAEALSRAVNGDPIALNARHSLSRSKLIHVRAKLAGGKLFPTKNLIKGQIKDIDSLLSISCDKIMKYREIIDDAIINKRKRLEASAGTNQIPKVELDRQLKTLFEENPNYIELKRLLRYIKKLMNKRLRLQSALLHIAVNRASFSSAHRIFLSIKVRYDNYIELLVNSSEVLDKARLRDFLENYKEQLEPDIHNRTLYHCIYYLITCQSFEQSQLAIRNDCRVNKTLEDNNQNTWLDDFSDSEHWKYATSFIESEFGTLKLNPNAYTFRKLADGYFQDLRQFFDEQKKHLTNLESGGNTDIENDITSDRKTMKMEEFFLLLNLIKNTGKLSGISQLVTKSIHGIECEALISRMRNINLIRHTEYFRNIALLEDYRERLRGLVTITEDVYDQDTHWLEKLERYFIENGNVNLRLQLLTLKAWHIKILKARIEHRIARSRNYASKVTSKELDRKYLNIMAEIESLTSSTSYYLRATDSTILETFKAENLVSEKNGFVPEYAPIFVC